MNRNAISIILIVLSIGIFYTFTNSRIQELKTIQATNSDYLSAINNSVDLITERDAVLKTYNSISTSDQARLNKMLPDNVDNVRLIIDVNGIAARHGFSIQNITTSADSSQGGSSSGSGLSESSGGSAPDSNQLYGAVTISFSFTASYQNFLAFLQDIQSSLRILDITHLTVTTNPTGTYTYSIQLTTYWLK
jgi:Tfp pilus assembly protein PilO